MNKYTATAITTLAALNDDTDATVYVYAFEGKTTRSAVIFSGSMSVRSARDLIANSDDNVCFAVRTN